MAPLSSNDESSPGPAVSRHQEAPLGQGPMGFSSWPGSPEARRVGGLWETWCLAVALLLTSYAPLDKPHTSLGLGFPICKIGQLNQIILKSFDSSTSSFSVFSGLSEACMPPE